MHDGEDLVRRPPALGGGAEALAMPRDPAATTLPAILPATTAAIVVATAVGVAAWSRILRWRGVIGVGVYRRGREVSISRHHFFLVLSATSNMHLGEDEALRVDTHLSDKKTGGETEGVTKKVRRVSTPAGPYYITELLLIHHGVPYGIPIECGEVFIIFKSNTRA